MNTFQQCALKVINGDLHFVENLWNAVEGKLKRAAYAELMPRSKAGEIDSIEDRVDDLLANLRCELLLKCVTGTLGEEYADFDVAVKLLTKALHNDVADMFRPRKTKIERFREDQDVASHFDLHESVEAPLMLGEVREAMLWARQNRHLWLKERDLAAYDRVMELSGAQYERYLLVAREMGVSAVTIKRRYLRVAKLMQAQLKVRLSWIAT